MDIDTQKVDEAVLALLYLGLHDGEFVWKGFDSEAMERLHAQGYFSNPVSKSKSMQFIEAGLQASARLFRERFTQ